MLIYTINYIKKLQIVKFLVLNLNRFQKDVCVLRIVRRAYIFYNINMLHKLGYFLYGSNLTSEGYPLGQIGFSGGWGKERLFFVKGFRGCFMVKGL